MPSQLRLSDNGVGGDGTAGKSLGLASAATIVINLMVMIQPAMAQSTDVARPGDLFSVDQVGKAAGQVLKNNGIYLDAGYLNDVLGVVKGGNETGVTSTGDAFVASRNNSPGWIKELAEAT